ncbi:type II toxin-antitoxin system RelE/ParE family toxin [Mesorhizobium sp. WSM4303]|uniref:type II toxin-antitoxin system RelE/ParE family toxin n=1 Tax=unclassified Mesorhizobium TaxID=325217 RepID=UPI00115F35E4|nr:type II toxin-antitoxin system RelE/ParE family toxin [Mesorhizobium sp. WSM4306]TRD03591.1 type II toxin-antitoxin system RelE/ParE family toxin [Mesorhizobium sp. WSM4303]
MKRLVFTDQAEADLEAIGDYIALDNPFRAVTFIQELRRDCVELRTMPERYPLFERHRSRGIRRRVHGNYLIFYRVGEILHILHGAMDPWGRLVPRQLKPAPSIRDGATSTIVVLPSRLALSRSHSGSTDGNASAPTDKSDGSR